MVGAARSEGSLPLPPVAGIAPSAPPGATPVTGTPDWREQTIQRETPEIRIQTDARVPFVFTLQGSGFSRRWDVDGQLYERIAVGEYDYAIYGPLYEATGQPDMAGKLRCRRFRLYEVNLVLTTGNSTSFTDLGDP
jgi:hypothetical protein